MFGFGKKHDGGDSTESVKQDAQTDEIDTAVTDTPIEGSEVEEAEVEEPGDDYDRWEMGPWDASEVGDDDDIKRIDIGALKVPVAEGMQLRLQVNKEKTAIVSAIVVIGDATLELNAIAAPRTAGLWEDISREIVDSNKSAQLTDGVFGDEVHLEVSVGNGKVVPSRIVGVDGPRWMLRGIFTGSAARSGVQQNNLNALFSKVVVERGSLPLAPRDLLPLHPPVDNRQVSEDEGSGPTVKDISKPDGPLSEDQQTQVQTTLARGPMFSEIR